MIPPCIKLHMLRAEAAEDVLIVGHFDGQGCKASVTV